MTSPDPSAELAALGREAARDAWLEHAGDLDAIPNPPELRARAKRPQTHGLPDSDRALTEPERRAFVHAYRNELQVLVAHDAPPGKPR